MPLTGWVGLGLAGHIEPVMSSLERFHLLRDLVATIENTRSNANKQHRSIVDMVRAPFPHRAKKDDDPLSHTSTIEFERSLYSLLTMSLVCWCDR
jgi:hypothetical protein